LELGSEPVIKINGIYRLGDCSCIAPQSCSDNFDTLYTVVADTTLGQLEMTPYNVAFRTMLYGTFASNTTGFISFEVNGLTCIGTLVRDFVCSDDIFRQACTVRFDCISGECFVTQVDKDLHTYVFPVVFSLVIILMGGYFLYMFLKPMNDNFKVVYVEGALRFLAVLQFFTGIFLLFGPAAYYGMMFIAIAVFVFHSRAHVPTDLAVDTALAVWGLFTLGGANSLVSSEGLDTSALFNFISQTYNSNDCYLMYGVVAGDPWCGMFLMFEMFATFLLLLIQAPMFLFSAYLWSHPVLDGKSTTLHRFYAYFGIVVPDDLDQSEPLTDRRTSDYDEDAGNDEQESGTIDGDDDEAREAAERRKAKQYAKKRPKQRKRAKEEDEVAYVGNKS